jgi:geranylgeranyl reductase family protein
MIHDVIVVGAGPGGSTAARECAERGLSVLLADKAEFPRDKPCGGGVNVRAARLLPFDLAPVIDHTAYGIEINLRRLSGVRRRSPQPLTYLTDRRRFDALLVERAVERGVALRQRAPIQAVSLLRDRVVVRLGSETLEARVLVAADGANGRTARLAGVVTGHRRGIAMEARAPLSTGAASRWEQVLGVNLGCVPGGFGWIFPKGDHFNVGVGGWAHEAAGLRLRLRELAAFYGLRASGLTKIAAHPMLVRRASGPLVSGRMMLVGDAAGLVDPLTGEGIHSAIASGRLAAAHIAQHLRGDAPDLEGYGRAVRAGLGAELGMALSLHDLVQLAPAAFLLGLEHADFPWQIIFQMVRGDQTLDAFARSVGPLWHLLTAASSVGRLARFVEHCRARLRRSAASAWHHASA